MILKKYNLSSNCLFAVCLSLSGSSEHHIIVIATKLFTIVTSHCQITPAKVNEVWPKAQFQLAQASV
jgi:hypothetical protein